MNNQLFKGTLNTLKTQCSCEELDKTKQLLVNMDESTFVSGVNAAIEKNRSYNEAKLSLYKSLTESADLATIHESFADYSAQALDIIEKFLKFISNKIEERCAMIDDFIASNKLIANHKKELTEIKHYDDDSREGYEYTFSDQIPNMSILDRFNASLFEELVQDQWTDLSVESIQSILANVNLEEDYRRVRAEVLGSTDGTGLSENEFEQALRAVYRNGKGSVELYITEDSIKSIAEKWFNHKQYYNTCLKNDIEKLVKSCEKVLDRIESICRNNNGLTVAAFTNLLPGDCRVQKIDGKDVDLQGMRISADMMVQLDLFCKLKLDQLQKYTDILCMALTAKADAMFSAVQQNAIILTDCIDYMKQNPSECGLKKDGE